MGDYVATTDDNGGVHINSGIPNHAFYLAATALGGHAWERAGRIWYDALHDRASARDRDVPPLRPHHVRRRDAPLRRRQRRGRRGRGRLGLRGRALAGLMRLKVRRTGGFAGIARESPVLDTDALPPDEAQALHTLVEEAELGDVGEPGRTRGPDRFTYELTVGDRRA